MFDPQGRLIYYGEAEVYVGVGDFIDGSLEGRVGVIDKCTDYFRLGTSLYVFCGCEFVLGLYVVSELCTLLVEKG